MKLFTLKHIQSRNRFRFASFTLVNTLRVVSLIVLIIAIVLFCNFIFSHNQPRSLLIQKKPSTNQITTQTNSQKIYGLALGDTLFGLSQNQLNAKFLTIADLGVNWIRIDMSWADIQPANSSEYNWSPLDRIMTTAKKYNIKVLGTIAYTPAWASPSSCGGSSKCAPADPYEFANFAAAVASRYASDGATTFEIWNEPNLESFWQPAPDPAAYTKLLAASYYAIKHVEPGDMVLSGGLGDLDNSSKSYNQQAFLQAMYVSGAKPYFDALGFHPYSFPVLPSYVVRWSGWSMMNDIPDSIRDIMAMYGDKNKKIWITEYGAPTNGPGAIATLNNFNLSNSPDHVDSNLQAEMLTEAVEDYNNDTWIGGFFWYSLQDLSNNTSSNENFFGLLQSNGMPKQAYNVYKQLIQTK